MPDRGALQITTPSDREIVMTRVFDAPRELVYEAFTTPELLKRWLGVHAGWTFAVCEVDIRTGGGYRYVWRRDDGYEMGMRGFCSEVVPPERIVASEKFDHAWYEGNCLSTVTFVERDGRTTLRMALLYDSKAIRDAVLASPMESGIAAGYNTLAALLESVMTTRRR